MRKMYSETFRSSRVNVLQTEELQLSSMIGHPKYIIDTNKGKTSFKWLGQLNQIVLSQVHPLVIDTLARWFSHLGSCHVSCWTEFIHNGQRMRAHPNYQSKGEWYDWAMIRFNGSTEPRSEDSVWLKCDYPAKIIAILRAPLKCFKDEIDAGTSKDDLNSKMIFGVLVLCTEEPLSAGDSCLCQQYQVETRASVITNSDNEPIKVLRPKLRLVPI